MIDLNNLEEIKKLDPRDTFGSTELLAKQCQEAWRQVGQISVPVGYNDIENIVCCGMGASIYGALVTKALIGPEMKYPFEIISDYHLPKYVSEKSLVILTSYSGTTEEVLSCATEAKAKNSKMLVLTKGGQLADFAKENNVPAYIFDGKLNPAGIPRLGNGYSVLGLLGLLFKAGIINIDEKKLTESLEKVIDEKDIVKANAMDAVTMFEGKIPVIIAAEHLAGNGQIFRNQFNETSKTFSAFYLVPDLNHHLMEGLQFPTENDLYFVLLDSNNYSDKIKKRMVLTKEVIVQNKRSVFSYNPKENNIYADFLNAMLFGSYLTLYLGLIYGQNPAINPWVDYFKNELKK